MVTNWATWWLLTGPTFFSGTIKLGFQAIFWCSVIILCFFLCRTTSKIFNCKSFLHQSFFWFPVFFVSNPFFLSLLFPDFYVFVQHQCFWFEKKASWKTTIFGEKGGVQQNGFLFINLCFAKCEKLSFFLWPFFANCGLMFKSTIK